MMLKLRQSFFKPVFRAPGPVILSLPASESDELIQAIDNAHVERDDNWYLTPVPDAVELESFWSRVQEDIHADSEWVSNSVD